MISAIIYMVFIVLLIPAVPSSSHGVENPVAVTLSVENPVEIKDNKEVLS